MPVCAREKKTPVQNFKTCCLFQAIIPCLTPISPAQTFGKNNPCPPTPQCYPSRLQRILLMHQVASRGSRGGAESCSFKKACVCLLLVIRSRGRLGRRRHATQSGLLRRVVSLALPPINASRARDRAWDTPMGFVPSLRFVPPCWGRVGSRKAVVAARPGGVDVLGLKGAEQRPLPLPM